MYEMTLDLMLFTAKVIIIVIVDIINNIIKIILLINATLQML